MKNYEIVDLILPETFDKEKAKKELNEKYENRYSGSELFIRDGWLENNASEYLKELEEILNSQPKYDREFWEKVIELNKENFNKIYIRLEFSVIVLNSLLFADKMAENNSMLVEKCSMQIPFNELDLINKQYRLLQEIYYSRLEGKWIIK